MTRTRKLWRCVGLGTVTLVSTIVLAPCGSSPSSTSSINEINWYTPTEILSLDISKNIDPYSGLAIGNSGSNFFRQGKNGKLNLDLAKNVEISDDGLIYTVTLRDNIKYSDGTAITAEDFVYSWRRITNPKTASAYSYLVASAHVLNAKEIIAGTKNISELGVKSDGNTVVFTLSSPSPQFMSLLSFTNFMPQSEKFIEKIGKDYGTTSDKALYSGPYIVKGWNGTSEKFTLVKNKYYWDADNIKMTKVNVQTIKKPDTAIQMYKNGELDFANISKTPSIYSANKSNKDVIAIPDASTSYFVYNQTGEVPSLANTKIRQALNLATNRKGIVDAATSTGSKVAIALTPTGLETLTNGTDFADYVAPGYTYNVKKAKNFFKEGLADLGKDSIKLTVTADNSSISKTIVDYVKETWEKALPGLTIEEKFLNYQHRLEDIDNQNFEIALVLWGADYPEASTFYGLFTTTSPYNYGKVSNADYDAIYEKALATDALNKDIMADDYKIAEKILYDNALYNPIYFRSEKALQNPSIKNLIRNSTGLSVDFTYAYKTK